MDFELTLQRAKGGDPDALQAVLVEQLPQLSCFVRLRSPAILRRRESCADMVQSICRQAIGSIGQLRGTTRPEFGKWLYTIALHKILERQDHHGAQKRDAWRDVDVPFDSRVDDEGLLNAYRDQRTPSQELVAREEVQRIEAAFDALTDEQREVLILARIVGLSHEEIASRLGKSEVTVRKTLSRARARLAMILAEPQ